jgi:hypothetical protein
MVKVKNLNDFMFLMVVVNKANNYLPALSVEKICLRRIHPSTCMPLLAEAYWVMPPFKFGSYSRRLRLMHSWHHT